MGELPKVTIYTDGACDPNPGPGGWAALLKFGPQEKILTGAASDSTNNRMELTAAIQGLEALSRPHQIQFFTDFRICKTGDHRVDAWVESTELAAKRGQTC